MAPYGWPVYRLHQRLIGLRRRHPWLTRATTTAVHLTNTAAALASTSPTDPGRRIVTLLNLGDAPVDVPVDTGGLGVLDADPAPDDRPTATVPAHRWSISARSTHRRGE